MPTRQSRAPATKRAQDATAIAFSALCALHCALLPLVLSLLPASLLWLEHEWVHRVFVLIAVPVSGYAIVTSVLRGSASWFVVGASVGLVLLVAPVLFESLHDYETGLTLAGAFSLAAAHILRWASRRASFSGQQQGA